MIRNGVFFFGWIGAVLPCLHISWRRYPVFFFEAILLKKDNNSTGNYQNLRSPSYIFSHSTVAPFSVCLFRVWYL
jgi:hypothetical protein